MRVVASIDQNGGMMFGGKRQSQDLIQREDLKKIVGDRMLIMKPYTYELYQDVFPEAIVSMQPFSFSGDYDVVVEDMDITPYLDQIDAIILYQWNRIYPGDFFFPHLDTHYKKISEEDFVGSSHANITRMIYGRRSENET